MTNLDWVGPLNDELRILLNPEIEVSVHESAELRAMRVARSHRETLYPFNPLLHAPSVRSLLRHDEFTSLAGPQLAGLDPLSWSTLTPDSLGGNPLSATLIGWHNANSNRYSLRDKATDEESAAIEVRRGLFEGSKFESRSNVVKSLLALPVVLHLLESYPFEGHLWQQSLNDRFCHELQDAAPRLNRTLALLKIYAPEALSA